MSDALWPGAAFVQNHYEPDWERRPEYILDKHRCHPLYDHPLARQHQATPSPGHRAAAHQHHYPDQYGAVLYETGKTLPHQTNPPASRPSARAVGRCRVVYRHAPPTAGPTIPARQPEPAPEPVREPETMSLLNPTGKFAQKVAGVRRLREFDESIPHDHLPQRRPAWRKVRGFIPWLQLVSRCRECQQPWPCHPLRANLHRRYGDNIEAKLHSLSTKKLRIQADKRSPTAVHHRGWTPRTWYGKPKPE